MYYGDALAITGDKSRPLSRRNQLSDLVPADSVGAMASANVTVDASVPPGSKHGS